MDLPIVFNDKLIDLKDWQRAPDYMLDVAVDPGLGKDVPAGITTSALMAWDPIKQQ